MPVIKSAKKQLKQSLKRKARNYPLRNATKTIIKKFLLLTKEGKVDEATKLLPKAYKTIDMACKKHILHKNNAANKKSLLARALNNALTKGKAAKKEKKEE